jgi:hypothetical protein
MNPVLLDWIGYIASSIVLISLVMSSIVRLRWINLVGALVFAFYGFMIGSIPTGFMNVGIVLIDAYYLAKIYLTKDYFTIIEAQENSNYLSGFLEFYKEDIASFNDMDQFEKSENQVKIYILRNMEIAGVFIASKVDDNTLKISLDYAIPRYRDFKLGQYLFETKKDYFTDKGYTRFIAYSDSDAHTKYLKKMGFEQQELEFIKTL